MTDEAKTQEQQDAELIADFRKDVREHNGVMLINLSSIGFGEQLLEDIPAAMLRTIDAKDARIKLLEGLLKGVTEMLEYAYDRGFSDPHKPPFSRNYKYKAEDIREALRNEEAQ